jgi:hypothetical protein
MTRYTNALLVALALLFGAFAGWADVHTDDTQFVVFFVLLFSFVLGVARPRLAWLWALIVGLGVPLAEEYAILTNMHTPWPQSGNLAGSLVAVVIAFAGAYAGFLLRRATAAGGPNPKGLRDL